MMNSLTLSLFKTLLSIKDRHPDHSSIVDLAVYHRIQPLIARETEHDLQEYLSSEEIKKLRKLAVQNKKKTMKKAMELCSLARIFHENKIDFIVLKGIPLSMELYGDIGMRPSKDIDILIRKEDAQKFIHLVKNDYHIDCKVNVKYDYDFSIVNKTSNELIEIHTRLCDNDYLLHGVEPFDDRRIIKILGMDIPTLSYENNLLYLLVHGAVHKYFRLIWLTDIYSLLSKEVQFDVQKIMVIARKYKIERIVLSSLLTCNRVFDWIVTDQSILDDYVNKDRKIKSLVESNLKAINDPTGVFYRGSLISECKRQIHNMKHMLQLKDDSKYKYEAYKRTFFAKRNEVIIPLPEKLHFLYIFIHPFFCIYRWFNDRYLKKKK